MSDNARFHNKLHRKNHHTRTTDGYPDSATDPIASPAEPFQGTFVVDGDISASGAISTIYYTLSNISIPTPVLSANVGFQPTNSLIVQLSGTKYAIPITLVGNKTFSGSTSGVNSLSAYPTYLNDVLVIGTLSGKDSVNWNSTYTTVSGNSAYWNGGNSAYTSVQGNSGKWASSYTTVNTNSGQWSSSVLVNAYVTTNSATFDNSYNVATFAKLSGQAYTYFSNTSSIQAVSTAGKSIGQYAGALAGVCNTASGYASLIAGGGNNTSSGSYSVVVGGAGNNAQGNSSGILGGFRNSISGVNSFAIGSNLVSDISNYTFVNNLSSQNNIYGGNTYVDFLDVSPGNIGTPLTNTRAQFFSNTAGFTQVNHQNFSNNYNASTDIVVTADNGNDTSNYLDMGINSSTYSNATYEITGPNDAYIYTQTCNLTIGTAGTADLILHTGGTLAANERVRVTASGYVGIGTTSPQQKLTIVGDVSASGNIYYNNTVYSFGAGTKSIVPTNGNNTSSGDYANILGGQYNVVQAVGAVVGGGYGNIAADSCTSVLGGCNNIACYQGSIIGGGSNNRTFSDYGSIVGGSDNITNCYSSIGGGYCNNASGPFSVIGGGCNNIIACEYSVIGGGFNNINNGCNSFIAGGSNNIINGNITNTFVLGSNLNALCSNYTYVNGIISDSDINAAVIKASDGISSACMFTQYLSADSADFYSIGVCDIYITRNAFINSNLDVTGQYLSAGIDLYDIFSSSSGDPAVNSIVYANSASWINTSSVVQTYSAAWSTGGFVVDSGVRALTGNWENTYSNVYTNSASWTDIGTFVSSNSASWGSGGVPYDLGVRAISGNWQNTYNTVNTLSGTWGGGSGIDTGVRAITSTFVTYASANNKFLPLSGGTVTGIISSNRTIYASVLTATNIYGNGSGITGIITRAVSAIGNGSSTTYNYSHNLNSRDVITQVYDNTTYAVVYPSITNTTTNSVTITFASVPALNAYKVVVIG